jgi:HSP20 family protein
MSQPGRAGSGRDGNALTGIREFRSELGRMVNAALAGAVGAGLPDVELAETEDGWVVVARLPGVAPEEVALEVDGRELCIRARSEEEVNADQGMPGTGLRMRGFEHRLRLPGQADLERIDAVMDHGLLTVALPRTTQSGRRTITIGRRYPASRAVPGTTSGKPALTGGAAARSTGDRASPSAELDPSSGGATRATADPAADRELHQPEAGSHQAARRHFS